MDLTLVHIKFVFGGPMQTVETEHYIFHYGAGTAAERDIEKIAALQEGVEV